MRMHRNTGWRLSLLVALLTLLALVVVACGGDATTTTKAPDTSATSATSATTETTAASTEPIKIGFAAGLTGNGAAAGQDFLNGVMLYVDQVNAAGGVLGRQIEIVSEDELNDPKNATTVAQKLVDAGVVAVIGHLTSGTTIPTLGIYAAAGIPQITPATNPDVTAQGIDSVFRVDPDDFAQGGNVGRYMFEKQGAKTAAIIHDKQAFGQGVAEQFQAAFEAAGGTVTSVNGITPGDVDFRAVLTKIKGEAPDMVYYGGVAAEGGLVIKQMRELGMEQKFIGPDQLFGPEFIKIGGTGAEGALVSFVAPPLDSTPELSKFLADYKAAYNEEPFVAQYGYDSILLIAEAIKAAGSTEGKDIAATLHAGTIKGILSDYSFEENGALAGGGVIHIYQVKDGADVWIDQTS